MQKGGGTEENICWTVASFPAPETSGAKTSKGEELSFAAVLAFWGLVMRDIYIESTWLAMAVFSTWIRG